MSVAVKTLAHQEGVHRAWGAGREGGTWDGAGFLGSRGAGREPEQELVPVVTESDPPEAPLLDV